ncbi:MAG: glutamate racemase [Bacteroidales bacterium]|jgi:glutamate racemase|nr:glutamate racemase [Bacteroidales bacterium]
MIGVFDSGFGGLTILDKFLEILPEYDYIFLGDNARAPYGNRSYETVYNYTLQAVKKLFSMGCPLVILGCNTASAKALRTIQQNDLPNMTPGNRVLGIIRPTAEIIADYTQSGKVGILGTSGTVNSKSYILEIKKLYPKIQVYQQACPLLAPLVENGEIDNPGTDYFVNKYLNLLLSQDSGIDTIILGCTHYPLLMNSFKKFVDSNIKIVPQNEIVAHSLKDYLSRHPEIDNRLTKNGTVKYFTTDNSTMFDQTAKLFLNRDIQSRTIEIF